MTGDPIEDYLDELYTRLRTSPRRARRVLAEAEDHLREFAAAGLAAGLSEQEAAKAAISGFGSAGAVARAHRRRLPAVAVLADLAVSAWKLAASGLLAIGASGLVAAVMNAALGPGFVGGAPTTIGVTAAGCRHYLAIWHTARSCGQAAMLETSSDAVSLRVAAGAAGVIMLVTWLIVARRAPRVLPDGFLPTVAATLFGTAAAGLACVTVFAPARHGLGGPGIYLSGAIVSAAAALGFAARLRHSLLLLARG